MSLPFYQRIYLDNAATTQVDSEVFNKMLPYFNNHYGNPSSVHSLGRETRLAVEKARKQIADLLNVKPRCLIFTSGGTESNNTAIRTAVTDLGCNHIITSAIEHHAVLHAVQHYAEKYGIGVTMVKLLEDGRLDQKDFKKILETKTGEGKKCFVTLMHANNETGQLADIRSISSICKKHGAIFHSDCVQTIGHLPLNLATEGVHMASASAHKFHGPKGIGFLYVHEDLHISPLIYGGGQEHGYRAGTENVASIVGMAEALSLSFQRYPKDRQYVSGLKQYLAGFIKQYFPGAVFNSGFNSLYSTLSVSFPKSDKMGMLSLELDMKGICVSGGSACSGGASSHVMEAMGRNENYVTLRFSFSRNNKKEEVDLVVDTLIDILEPQQTSLANIGFTNNYQ